MTRQPHIEDDMAITSVVFGHTSQLGRAISARLLDAGGSVLGVARSRWNDAPPALTEIQADLSNDDDLERTCDIISQDYPSFSSLIYAIGGLTAHEMDDLSLPDLQYVYRLNTFAPMLIESRLLPLIEANGADVVNITSSSIIEYYPKLTEYSSSKIALQKFTADLQRRLRNTHARVIEVCPSGFTSDIYKNMRGDRIPRDEALQIPAERLADLIVYVLQLPKIMEVAHLFVNRKSV